MLSKYAKQCVAAPCWYAVARQLAVDLSGHLVHALGFGFLVRALATRELLRHGDCPQAASQHKANLGGANQQHQQHKLLLIEQKKRRAQRIGSQTVCDWRLGIASNSCGVMTTAIQSYTLCCLKCVQSSIAKCHLGSIKPPPKEKTNNITDEYGLQSMPLYLYGCNVQPTD